MAAMVANPLYEALRNALNAVGPLIDEVNTDIEAPYRRFEAGTVWTGPTARQFGDQFARFRARVRASGERIVGDLQTALSRTPPRVTEQEAEAIRKSYGLP